MYAPGLTAAEREYFCARSDGPPSRRGEVAAHAPGLTFAERKTFCEWSDDPPYWRGKVMAFWSAE